jgi:hypothetical protein
MKPATDVLNIAKGKTFRRVYTRYNPDGSKTNLTGYSALLQVRASVEDSVVLLEMSTADGQIVLGGALGTITPCGRRNPDSSSAATRGRAWLPRHRFLDRVRRLGGRGGN